MEYIVWGVKEGEADYMESVIAEGINTRQEAEAIAKSAQGYRKTRISTFSMNFTGRDLANQFKRSVRV
jgi:hypothetical protein